MYLVKIGGNFFFKCLNYYYILQYDKKCGVCEFNILFALEPAPTIIQNKFKKTHVSSMLLIQSKKGMDFQLMIYVLSVSNTSITVATKLLCNFRPIEMHQSFT